jgi:N-methylhydantoinase A
MPVDTAVVQKLLDELASGVADDLAADGIPPADRSVQFEGDLRFAKQTFELQVPIEAARFDDSTAEALLDGFRAEYAKRYGQGSIVLGAPLELVGVRAVGIGRTVRAALDTGPADSVEPGTPAPPRGQRAVRLGRGDGGIIDVAVLDSGALRCGHRVAGPALVDGSDTTTWVPPGAVGDVDAHGTLTLEVGP